MIREKIQGELVAIDGQDLINADINKKVREYFAKWTDKKTNGQ